MKSSIIICTYNEGTAFSEVLSSVCSLNPDSEIIVVDDGSTDKTESLARELSGKYSFRYERFERNRGKSWAMAHGVEMASSDIILFFDADVSNIRKEHFDMLLGPVIDGSADMVLGQPSETMIDYRVNPFKALTGERALRKEDIMPVLGEIRHIRFGVETFLNMYYQAQGRKIKYVLLKDLKHPSTYEKSGSFVIATKKYLKEGKEIFQTLMYNDDLIRQRVELLINRRNQRAKRKLDSIQKEINGKLQDLKEKLEK